ncbi:uncharacterized protein LOC132607785 [Lycium barbarum]|uniref:uncharacterized protein LOC132607785 n=1 Tax=Lycium barbarum TaxID=112863 RepID=UPI00293F5F4F|nr:uncharacterized protein LOC132607785 [Lycium barbarum]
MIQHPDSNHIDPLRIRLKEEHAHCCHVEAEPDGKPWNNDIKMYLERREYPEAYQQQMNGVVEAANKNIKRILRKMIDNYKGCHEQLPYALLGYRTTARTSTGATTYLLVYVTKVGIPAEVEIPSLRIIQEAELDNVEWVLARYEQLALIYEKMIVSVCHGQLYCQRMERSFNKRVRARHFQIEQMVLKRIVPHQDEYKGKFAPNCKGPYVVRKVLSERAVVLAEMDGQEWPKPINSDELKRYYA